MALLNSLARLALALALTEMPSFAQSPARDEQKEYALKSVFVLNFCRFIEWPQRPGQPSAEAFVIGIVGRDPFGPLLAEAVQGETLHGRPIRIERYSGPEDIRRPDLLLVPQSEDGRASQIIAAVRGRGVVTVGETESFLNAGGMIALIADQNRVRLRIQPARLRAAGLVASSKLLRIADTRN